jgi:hypothetical protein
VAPDASRFFLEGSSSRGGGNVHEWPVYAA